MLPQLRRQARRGAALTVAVLLATGLAGCAPRGGRDTAATLDAAGERYARLALALGRHDPDYVDSFYGPEEWKRAAERDTLSLGRIALEADSLAAVLGGAGPPDRDELTTLRRRFIRRQLGAMSARARMLAGDTLSFDRESQALYDVVAPYTDDGVFAPALARLDSLLPGRGPLAERWENYRKAFIIPPARLDTVFRAAIEEARRRTRAHVPLPDSESFVVEYVKHKPWGGYNWYQGGYRSLIQVNVDLPIYLDRALDLACHEGYPGHHVNNVLMERALVRERGWREFTLLPLFSPQGVIEEGAATVAPRVAFPGVERERFERDVLCPLAGIDSVRYRSYVLIRDALDSLSMASIEGARRYLDHRLTREQAIRWLGEHALQTPERARKSLSFDERYRSYVVNYGLGRRMVLAWLAANGGDDTHPARRWELFGQLLATPRLPADLRGSR